MERKVSRRSLLKLPLARENEKRVTGIDERASNESDIPGHLVIETSKDSSVNLLF